MKELKKIIKDIIPVVIGILIALFINNWNENRKDENYLNKILSSIKKELRDSSIDIEQVIPKQVTSIDTLDYYLNNEKISLYSVMIKGNGIHIPNIRTNSWNAIANSKIELIEYEKLSELTDIQERKENLNMKIERKMDFIFQNFENTDRAKKVILRMMLSDIIETEKELKDKIDNLIDEKSLN